MPYPNFPTFEFTVGPIDAQSFGDFNQAIGANRFIVLKLIMEPSEAETNNRLEIYQTADIDYSPNELAYGTTDFDGDLIEPMEEKGQGPTERTLGLPFVYIDQDEDSAGSQGGGTLHGRIYNNHTQAQSYTIRGVYWPFLKPTAGGGIALTGDPDAGDEEVEIAQIADSTVQRIAVRKNSTGDDVGTRRRLNLIEGNNITLTIADDSVGNELDVTITGAGAQNKTRNIDLDTAQIVSGSPLTAIVDNKGCIQLRDTADAEIAFQCRVPADAVVSGDIFIAINYRPHSAPGTTNNKVKLDTRYKIGNASLSSAVTDTLTLANDTDWAAYTGTNNKIPGATVAVGDLVEFRIKRDVSVANNAAVLFDMAMVQLQYTSSQ